MNIQDLIGYQPPKNINEIIKESIQLRAPFQHFSTVMITSRDGIIKGIGQSKPNNLILDSFGIWLGSIFRTGTATESAIFNLTDITNTARSIRIYFDAIGENPFNYVGAGRLGGTQIQCGSGTTTATRADYNVETALPTAPEDDIFDTGPGSYAGGIISVVGAVSAGGAGTINETLMYARWRDASLASAHVFALFHDLLVSGEAFVLGETITVTYTINL